MLVENIDTPDISKDKYIYSHSSLKVKYSFVKFDPKIFELSRRSIKQKIIK